MACLGLLLLLFDWFTLGLGDFLLSDPYALLLTRVIGVPLAEAKCLKSCDGGWRRPLPEEAVKDDRDRKSILKSFLR